MKRVIIGKYRVDFYEAIDEMPIVRYKEYNKYLLIDSGIGSSAEDIERNIGKLARFVSKGEKDNSIKQLMLLKQNLYFVMEGESPEFLAFACLIHAVNEEEIRDISAENLNRVLDKFRDRLTPKALRSILDKIKKKVNEEMEEFFPALTDSVLVKQYYTLLQKRTILVLREVTENVDLSEEILKIDMEIMDSEKPEIFHGDESREISYQKEFEEMCFILNQKLNKEAKSMTVLEFYNAFEMLKKQQPKKQKTNGK